jgi:hypothetical protein
MCLRRRADVSRAQSSALALFASSLDWLRRVAASVLIVLAVAFGAVAAVIAGTLVGLAGLFAAREPRPQVITVRARHVGPASGWSSDLRGR